MKLHFAAILKCFHEEDVEWLAIGDRALAEPVDGDLQRARFR